MINLISGYSRRAPGFGSPPRAQEPANRGAAAQAGSLAKFQNPALLETLQTGRETSALLSSLSGPGDRFFRAPSPPALAPQGQPRTQRPSVALLETLQTGRETSALLSSIMAPTAGVRSPVSSGFSNPGAALTSAEEMLSATETGQPSAQNSRIAHDAYLMEVRAQRQLEQRALMGAAPTHGWMA